MTNVPFYTLHHVHPAPAKLLFTFDDGWNKFLDKYGDSVSEWTKLSVNEAAWLLQIDVWQNGDILKRLNRR